MTDDPARLDQMIAVLQAAKAGKTVQICAGGEWQDIKQPLFNFANYKHRVKPDEPRTWILPAHTLDALHCQGAVCVDSPERYGFVRVREVLE